MCCKDGDTSRVSVRRQLVATVVVWFFQATTWLNDVSGQNPLGPPAWERPVMDPVVTPKSQLGEPIRPTSYSSESIPEAAYGSSGLLPEAAGLTPAPQRSYDPSRYEAYAAESIAPPMASRQKPKAGPPGDSAPFNVQSFWMPTQRFADGVDDYSIYGESLAFGVPLSMSEEGMWIATGYVDHYGISTGRRLVNSNLDIPDHLYAVGMGLMRTRNFENGWKAGGMFSLGSASDRPFEAGRDLTLTSLVFLEVPWGPIDSWKFSLFYSPTAQLNFPLPGIAYVWHPNPAWEINVGLPFAVKYKPNERFTFTGNYVPLTNVRLMANYDWTPAWSSYAGYAVTNEVFWLSDRQRDEERFFLFDQRLSVGIKRKLGRGFVLDFSTAYVFDRQLIQSEDFSTNRRDDLSIDPGVAAFLQLSWYP